MDTRSAIARSLLFLSILVLLGLDISPVLAQKKQVQPQRYEYAELSFWNSKCRWETESEVIEAASYQDMADKFGKKTDKNYSTALLGILGERGWEIVTHQTVYNGGTREHFWILRRAVPVRWEYGELSWWNSKCRWETDTDVVETANYVDMAAKLGQKTDKNHSTAVLNVLGAQGWELVTHQTVYNGGTREHFWILRRAVRAGKKD
jgi:hypothetical protein